jgi:hypothetical protein
MKSDMNENWDEGLEEGEIKLTEDNERKISSNPSSSAISDAINQIRDQMTGEQGKEKFPANIGQSNYSTEEVHLGKNDFKNIHSPNTLARSPLSTISNFGTSNIGISIAYIR